MPVMRTSRRRISHRRAPPSGKPIRAAVCFHGGAEFVGKRHDAERQFGVASRFAVDLDRSLGDGIAGAVMDQFSGDSRLVPGATNARSLASLTAARNGMRSKLFIADDQPARCLRHRLDQQHARHQRMAGEVAFENGAFTWNRGFDADRALREVQIDDPVDELKILEAHVCGALARDQRTMGTGLACNQLTQIAQRRSRALTR